MFIQEIETLLREYETAALPSEVRSAPNPNNSTPQDTLYRNISTLLRQPPAGITKKLVLDYRRRLTAAARRSSRNSTWQSLNSAPS